MTEEDYTAAVIFGVSVKISSLLHSYAVSNGLDTVLLLSALMLASILFASSQWEGRRP